MLQLQVFEFLCKICLRDLGFDEDEENNAVLVDGF